MDEEEEESGSGEAADLGVKVAAEEAVESAAELEESRMTLEDAEICNGGRALCRAWGSH